MIDMEKLEAAGALILEGIGETARPDVEETPKRFAKMLAEMLANTGVDVKDIAAKHGKTFETSSTSVVVERDIRCFSFCEHHLALMLLDVSIAYRPKGKILGLSKLSRIADAVCRRPQVQERITKEIADAIAMTTEAEDIAVVVKGRHSCVEARGIRSTNAWTETRDVRGFLYGCPI